MNDKIIRVIQHKFTIPIATAVVSGGAFGVAGYMLGRRASKRLLSNEAPDDKRAEKQAKLDQTNKDIAYLDGLILRKAKDISSAMRSEIDDREDEDYVEEPETYHVVQTNAPFDATHVGRNSHTTGFSDEPLYSDLELDWDAELSIEDQEVYDAKSDTGYNVFSKNKKDESVQRYENSLSEWDMELELSTRNGREPYVIHFDEFDEHDGSEGGFVQKTLTYYEGDDIMTDEHDTPIYQYHTVTGFLKFGHGSKDPNVVYIRNEELQLEVEVLYMPGRYEVEVLGLDDEETFVEGQIRHARTKRLAKLAKESEE